MLLALNPGQGLQRSRLSADRIGRKSPEPQCHLLHTFLLVVSRETEGRFCLLQRLHVP